MAEQPRRKCGCTHLSVPRVPVSAEESTVLVYAGGMQSAHRSRRARRRVRLHDSRPEATVELREREARMAAYLSMCIMHVLARGFGHGARHSDTAIDKLKTSSPRARCGMENEKRREKAVCTKSDSSGLLCSIHRTAGPAPGPYTGSTRRSRPLALRAETVRAAHSTSRSRTCTRAFPSHTGKHHTLCP